MDNTTLTAGREKRKKGQYGSDNIIKKSQDMVELYDAQEGLIKAQSSQIDAYYDALYAYLDLQAQVGAISRGLMTEVSGEH